MEVNDEGKLVISFGDVVGYVEPGRDSGFGYEDDVFG